MFFQRFRDQKGNRVPLASATNAARALVYAALRVGTGFRPAAPSISQTAAQRMSALLPKTARIAEFGSGLSTVWFARHFAEVVSVEHEAHWAKLVTDKLRAAERDNVTYLVKPVADYESAIDTYPDGYFDLILVDGLKRDLCLQHAFPKLKDGGYVYLDNTDADIGIDDGEMRRTERLLLDAVQASGGSIEYFTDFAPINFFAEQGALAKIGGARTR
jgi:predicted O-methyltransferase YrrM